MVSITMNMYAFCGVYGGTHRTIRLIKGLLNFDIRLLLNILNFENWRFLWILWEFFFAVWPRWTKIFKAAIDLWKKCPVLRIRHRREYFLGMRPNLGYWPSFDNSLDLCPIFSILIKGLQKKPFLCFIPSPVSLCLRHPLLQFTNYYKKRKQLGLNQHKTPSSNASYSIIWVNILKPLVWVSEFNIESVKMIKYRMSCSLACRAEKRPKHKNKSQPRASDTKIIVSGYNWENLRFFCSCVFSRCYTISKSILELFYMLNSITTAIFHHFILLSTSTDDMGSIFKTWSVVFKIGQVDSKHDDW